jgi:hypothetical protein
MTLPALPNMDVVVVRLIVCSAHLIAALFQRSHGFRIAVCRPGASSWSAARKLHAWIFDIAFYQEKLYAVNYLNDLMLIALDISVDDNTGDPRVARIETVVVLALPLHRRPTPKTGPRVNDLQGPMCAWLAQNGCNRVGINTK